MFSNNLLKVRLFNGKKYEGQVLGLDLVRDIAVLKIEAVSLTVIL